MAPNAVTEAVAAPVAIADEVGLWNTVLRRYGATLDAHRALLVSLLEEHLPAAAYELPGAFEPPRGMPPMPPDARAFANKLQGETNELIRDASALLARSEEHSANRRRPETHSTPAAMDRRL